MNAIDNEHEYIRSKTQNNKKMWWKQSHSNQCDAFKSILLVWLSADFSLQMMRLDVVHLKYTIEFRVTVCVHVFM